MTLSVSRNVIIAIVAVLVVGMGVFAFSRGWIPPVPVPPTETPSPTLSAQNGIFNVPKGFSVEMVIKGLNKPRVIAFDPNGRMLVSEMGAGNVVVIESGRKRTVIGGLNSPHGLAFYTDPKTKKTFLYVAETNRVTRYEYDVARGTVLSKTPQIIASLPSGGKHFTRTIAFGPNFRKTPVLEGYLEREQLVKERVYIGVGSSCDACVEDTWKRAAILESDPEGTFTAEFAGGLRNSVFFAFHPVTGQLWATEMGRDELGDDLPPDEINIVRAAEKDTPFGARRYGWPFCYGKQVRDTKFNPEKVDRIDISSDCTQTQSSHIEIPAHSAPLGLAFIPSAGGWPREWRNDLLVAYHGSWNRSEKTGYKIVRYNLDDQGRMLGVEDFMTGFLENNRVNGRPVDLKFDNTGTLYVTDDFAGVIYRITLK
ncbi:MAG: PQQ-dependent sugar dehydrogenase [Patescibacteria group bacterium]